MALFSRSFDREKTLKQAEKHAQQGKLEAAIKDYELVAQTDPKDVTIANILGDLYQRVNRTQEAAGRFAMVAEHYVRQQQLPQAIALYKKIIRLQPDQPEYNLALGNLHRKQGMVADASAIRALEQAIRYQPSRKARQRLEALTGHKADKPATTSATNFPEGFESPSAVGYYDRMTAGATSPAGVTPSAERAATTSGEYSLALLDSLLVQNPEMMQARLMLVERMVAAQPDVLETRLQLKDMYAEAGRKTDAAREAMVLAQMYQARGDADKAAELRAEALSLDPNAALLPAMPQPPPMTAPPPAMPLSFEMPGGLTNLLMGSPAAESPGAGRLSDLLTPAQFQKLHGREWNRAARQGYPLTLCLARLDFFESYPAAFRQPCLEVVAGLFDAQLAPVGGIVAYDPGEGFLVLIPDVDAEQGREQAENLRTAIQQKGIPHAASPHRVLTLSVAVTSDLPLFEGMPFDKFVAVLCDALAQVTSRGGNLVTVVPAAYRRPDGPRGTGRQAGSPKSNGHD